VIGAGGEPAAIPVLRAEAEAHGAVAILAGDDVDGEVGLAGAHQRKNAACAWAALEALGIDAAARQQGIARVRWPGRLGGLLFGALPIVLDAAHNPQGAAALAASLGGEPYVAVVGVSADKDVRGVVAPVLARASAVVATQAPSARAVPAA